MSRDSGSDDDEEEPMISHIDCDVDYDGSSSIEDMELYTDIGSSSMEDMELYTDIGSSSMEDMDIYTDNFFPCMDAHEYLSRMELDHFCAMQEEAHHQQAMTFTKFQGTFYHGTSSSPRYSPSSSRRCHKHQGDKAHDPHR